MQAMKGEERGGEREGRGQDQYQIMNTEVANRGVFSI